MRFQDTVKVLKERESVVVIGFAGIGKSTGANANVRNICVNQDAQNMSCIS